MLKTVTFTLMHFCIAFTVTYALTGSAAAGGLVAAIEPLCNSVGFYLHERVWQRLEKRQRSGDEIPSHAWLHHHA
ncbi:membrane protein [Stutzerimonas stutzeri]|uniref:Membrane protein n=1 Tax=Stutzerimonas stutzeri TaxID=316 RepID=W8RSN2_STUST|nr:DUF2061 domain-containing protein [Stutzerimonas stutzeri]AHL75056.1 membrane protein [Stutzerimonas stutzeri]MCQ4331381.1 DUF2061 domain-containing protein [Stutzerimonas stutzeri]